MHKSTCKDRASSEPCVPVSMVHCRLFTKDTDFTILQGPQDSKVQTRIQLCLIVSFIVSLYLYHHNAVCMCDEPASKPLDCIIDVHQDSECCTATISQKVSNVTSSLNPYKGSPPKVVVPYKYQTFTKMHMNLKSLYFFCWKTSSVSCSKLLFTYLSENAN